MPGAQRGVVQVSPATGSKGASPRSTTTAAGGVLHRQGPVQQRLVGHDLARARTAVGAHDHLGRGIVDALRQVDRGEAAEHHRMHRADAGAGQHGEDGLGHHGHVQQDAVAAFHAQFEHGGGGVDLFIDILARDRSRSTSVDTDQRRILRLREPPVDGVVTEIGLAAHEPLGEGRPGEVQHGLERRFPMHPAPARARKRPGRVSIGNGNPWFCMVVSCYRAYAFWLIAFCFKLWVILVGKPCTRLAAGQKFCHASTPHGRRAGYSNEPVLKFGRIPAKL